MKDEITITLRGDQADLIAECLALIRVQLVREGRTAHETLEMAGRYTAKRIDEVLALVRKPNPGLERTRTRSGSEVRSEPLFGPMIALCALACWR